MGHKVVHVHFLATHKNFYYGSVKSIYKDFTSKDIGCTEDYLRHQINEDGTNYLNQKVLVTRSHLR